MRHERCTMWCRRDKGCCSLCLSPQILSAITGTASSFGLSASSDDTTQTNAVGSICTGITSLNAIAASTVDINEMILNPLERDWWMVTGDW